MDQFIEVAEGLSAGDRIINNPVAALLEDDKVRVVTPEPGYVGTEMPAPTVAPMPHDYATK